MFMGFFLPLHRSWFYCRFLTFLNDKSAVEHVHTAGETELTSFIWGKLQRCPGKRCQCLASLEIREDNPRTALTSFLPIKDEAQRDIFLDPDYIR
jgi:hypothetical protein